MALVNVGVDVGAFFAGAVLEVSWVGHEVPTVIFNTCFSNVYGDFGTELSLGVLKLHGKKKQKPVNDNEKGSRDNKEGGSDGAFFMHN